MRNFAGLLNSPPVHDIRDTALCPTFRAGFENKDKKTPSLKWLAEHYLGLKVQEGEHSSIEDAQAAMGLYVKFMGPWEEAIAVVMGPMAKAASATRWNLSSSSP